MNPLSYGCFTPWHLTERIIGGALHGTGNCLFEYFAFGKLPENPIVTPSTSVQVIRPSGVNRYLQSVTVNATSTTTA